MRMILLDLHTRTQWYCTHIHSGIAHTYTVALHTHTQWYCTHIHSGIAHTYTVVLRTRKQWYYTHIHSGIGIAHTYTVVFNRLIAHPKGIIGDVDPEMIGVEKVFI